MDALQDYVPRLARPEDFGRILGVFAVVLQKACVHAIGANTIRAVEGLTWPRRQQIKCTQIQLWVRARATSSVVVVLCVVLVAHDAVFLPEVWAPPSLCEPLGIQSSFSCLVLCYHLLLCCHSSLRRHVSVRCISSSGNYTCHIMSFNLHCYVV